MPIKFSPLPEISERDIQRFWEKVEFNTDPNTCWQWLGGELGGYPRFDWSRGRDNKRSLLGHRLSYYMHHKSDPEKIIVQTCGNKMCVNPNHLEAREELTNKQALQEGDKIGALIFVRRVPAKHPKRVYAIFRCECGKEFENRVDMVKIGKVKSCGCKTKEFLSAASTKHAPKQISEDGTKVMPIFRPEDIQRFWGKVNCDSNAHHCWDWMTANNGRYGYFNMGQAGSFKTNRVAYFLHYDKDPGELKVLHSCDRGICCNPFHLSLGTQDDNMNDMVERKRARNQYTGKNEDFL